LSPLIRLRHLLPSAEGRRVAIYGLAGGLGLVLLQYIEYQHFVRAYPAKVYGGLVAVIFTVVGISLGLKLKRRVPAIAPFALNAEKLKELRITPREHEILGLIAEGLSNREIGERLFVSENTVKTHSSRLFEKLGVNRRVQAIQKGKELGLIP
jgi:DNA-binding NarL/FixJ family response regulator